MAREQKQVTLRRWQRGVTSFAAAAGLLFGGSVVALAADRPSEADMFGGGGPGGSAPDGRVGAVAPGAGGVGGAAGTLPPASPPVAISTAAPVPAPAPAANATNEVFPASPGGKVPSGEPLRDEALLGDPNAGPRLSEDTAPEDPLKIGGQLYLRAAYANPGSPQFDFSDPTVAKRRYVTFSTPSLVDAYFDARPNDRVRGFVLGRMFFDPTLPSALPVMSGARTTTANPSAPQLSGVANTRGPTTLLDQLWLRFDVFHRIFVTAGRQHVKWGTARFWTPTDYLHPEHRNPVAVFDARPGFTMLKLHVPWEERGWNFYAFGLVEGVRRWDPVTNTVPSGMDTTSTLGQVGGAARAELVFGPAELALDAVVYKDQKARFGADLSFGVGDFDFYVDAGLRYGSELPRLNSNCATLGTMPTSCIYYSVGIKPQVAGGGTYSLKYNDNDVFTLGGEYFYNSRGYNDPAVYPGLFATGTFEFFYTGRHYAALFASLPAPWSWNYSTFSVATLGNLSDQSFLSRFDYSYVLLTHITFEAFGSVNYGRREGEFRLGVNDILVNGNTISLKPQAFSVGVGLRVKI